MPSCIKCGAFTKYFNGRCWTCYSGKTSKAGKVYIGKVTFPSGKSTIYTGQTRRSVFQRVKEHLGYQRAGNSEHYTGRGINFELKGSIFSKDRFKAEKTIKGLSREEKLGLAKIGARNFRRRY